MLLTGAAAATACRGRPSALPRPHGRPHCRSPGRWLGRQQPHENGGLYLGAHGSPNSGLPRPVDHLTATCGVRRAQEAGEGRDRSSQMCCGVPCPRGRPPRGGQGSWHLGSTPPDAAFAPLSSPRAPVCPQHQVRPPSWPASICPGGSAGAQDGEASRRPGAPGSVGWGGEGQPCGRPRKAAVPGPSSPGRGRLGLRPPSIPLPCHCLARSSSPVTTAHKAKSSWAEPGLGQP